MKLRSHHVGLLLLFSACRAAVDTSGIAVPREEDWREIGVVLAVGPEGAWDARFAGASTPSTIVQRDGGFFLYYGGADGSRSTDGGPRHRAIGLATSPDGIHFEKHPANPVMAHLPSGGEEEGANSAGVCLDAEDQFVMHYGAATEQTRDLIHADGRVAVSSDGVRFRDLGTVVLDHRDRDLYGYGDEIFPLACYRHLGKWYVFYTPNGALNRRDLAVAWGPSIEHLPDSAPVVTAGPKNPARTAANIIRVDEDRILIFVQRGYYPQVNVAVHAARADAPQQLSAPLARYRGPLWAERTRFFTVFHDERRRSWLLYRMNWEGQFVLHTAPAGAPDQTPPSAPHSLTARGIDGGIELAWDPASDPETGVAHYVVRRDGQEVATTLGWTWRDEPSAGSDAVTYAVSALNLHGIEGPAAQVGLAGARGG